MDFRILGPLEVFSEGRDVAPGRAKTRALLALLLVNANTRVPTERIVDSLWGDEPPDTADKALQGHVSALRKLLGPARIRTDQGAYRLEVGADELDAARFAAAVATARGSRHPRDRSRQLEEALALWRGEPLAEFTDAPFAQAAIARLESLRLAALEARAEVELALGRHVDILPELELLVARHPLAEGLRAHLMLALYRVGRQADALASYRDGRKRLVEDLGIEPGAALQQLERQILVQDPALAAPVGGLEAAAARQERRVVTLLVTEVVPSPGTDPEDLGRVARPTLARMRSIVERLGGTSEPLFANALLGVFGAPRAHDDDPLRAVRAGLEIRASNADRGVDLRVGIDTGDALVTIDEGRVEITGAVLGAASHLQATAPLGDIVVGEATRRATERAVEYAASASGAGAALALRSRGMPSAPETPFVGRADDLALLERIYGRARDERSVQLVTVAAEPGAGKSRLVRELRGRLGTGDDAPRWLQGQCLPYGDGITYWALGEIVKAEAGILESDDSEASHRKLANAIAAIEPDDARRSWLERNLAALVGVEGAGGSGDRDQAFAVWRQFLEAIARTEPLVLVFEDIHWADEALLEFIEHLVVAASGVPLLVLCTARLELLEAQPRWGGGKRNATTLTLEPLSPADTEILLRTLLGRDPDEQVVRRTGGNPLFAHELAIVVDRVAPGAATAIPESIQAVIAARLDTLAPELKALAADAAVVGEVFWSGAVAAIGRLERREIGPRLHRIVANDVARPRHASSVAGEDEYRFLHVLVRDVAYAQIPRRDRATKHRAAAAWIERLGGERSGGERLTNHAELVAHHYGEALELVRGLGDEDQVAELQPRVRDAFLLAGERTQRVDLAQAESFYRRALDLATPGDRAHGRVLSRLGEVADLTGRLAEAEQLLDDAVRELRRTGDHQGAGETLVILVTTLWRLGRPEPDRRRVAEEAVRTLEQGPPGAALVRSYARMATHELHAGRADSCGAWAAKALALADTLGDPALKVQPLHLLGIARFESGDDGGIEDLREAMRLGLAAGLSSETGTAHSNLAAVVWVSQGPIAALELKRGAAAFAADRGLLALERTVRAESLWQLHDAGLWDAALELASELIASETERDRPTSRIATMARTVTARILADRGRIDEAAAVEAAYLARARELGDPQDLGPALAAGAALRAVIGDVHGAAELIRELESVTRGRDPSQRVHELPHAARICFAGGAIEVAEALIPEHDAPTYTRARLCLASGRAIVAEAHGQLAAAAEQHALTAGAWREFGNPAEEAQSLLGAARCHIGLGQLDEARIHARAAHDLGTSLGAVAIVSEAGALLAEIEEWDVPPSALDAPTLERPALEGST